MPSRKALSSCKRESLFLNLCDSEVHDDSLHVSFGSPFTISDYYYRTPSPLSSARSFVLDIDIATTPRKPSVISKSADVEDQEQELDAEAQYVTIPIAISRSCLPPPPPVEDHLLEVNSNYNKPSGSSLLVPARQLDSERAYGVHGDLRDHAMPGARSIIDTAFHHGNDAHLCQEASRAKVTELLHKMPRSMYMDPRPSAFHAPSDEWDTDSSCSATTESEGDSFVTVDEDQDWDTLPSNDQVGRFAVSSHINKPQMRSTDTRSINPLSNDIHDSEPANFGLDKRLVAPFEYPESIAPPAKRTTTASAFSFFRKFK